MPEPQQVVSGNLKKKNQPEQGWNRGFFPNFLMLLLKWRSASRGFSQIWLQNK